MTATKAAHEDEGEEGNCEGDADRDYNARGDARGGGDGRWRWRWRTNTIGIWPSTIGCTWKVAVRIVRMVVVRIVRMVVVRSVAVPVEFAAARCAHAVRGAGGTFGVGGSGGGGLHSYSYSAAQLEEEQNKSEHRAARCVCGRHSYLRELLLGRKRGSSVLTTSDGTVVSELRFSGGFPIAALSVFAARTVFFEGTCSSSKTPGEPGHTRQSSSRNPT